MSYASVLILTSNEEQDLPGALASVSWSDDVHVFDSFSTDATVSIAEGLGAKVAQRAFDNYAAQRNAALNQTRFRHPWVLLLDADERCTPALREEIERIARHNDHGIAAYRIRRRDYFQNTWLKHAQISPWYVRLVRPELARYSREINEVLEIAGAIGELASPLDHYPFSKGISHWFRRHDVYSTMEARLIADGGGLSAPSLRTALTSRDFHERRLHQKALFYRMPARSLLKWLYMVVVRRAFLDGRAGMTYAWLQAIYEYMIVLKTREMRDRAAREHDSAS
ncbi:MAG: glycosyl transferase, family 2 [Acidobacteriaceae bacterium]|nr:glycosyl transferase, family 2 [Acidobacteriaceae bacterium]